MRNISLIMTLFCTSLIVSNNVEAQEIDFSPCQPLSSILDLAKINSPGVLIAEAEISESEAGIEEAKSLFKPQISAFGRSGFGDTGITDSSVSNQIGVRASQRLFDFGDSKYAREAARADLEEKEFLAEQQINNAVLGSLRAVLDYYQANAQSQLTEQRRNFFQTQKTSTENLLAQGGATLTELANVSSRLAEAETFNAELEFVKSRALAELESDTRQSVRLCESVVKVNELFPVIESFRANGYAKQIAKDKSPQLKSLWKRVENLDAVEKRQKSNRLPTIELVGTGSYASFNSFDNFEFRDRVGVDVSLPLYGGTIIAREKRAKARSNLARAEYTRALRQAEENIDITNRRIASLETQWQHRLETEKQMKLRFDSAVIEKNAGVRTLSQLIEIRLEYESAGLARINAEFEIQRQMLVLMEQIGF